MPFEDGRPVNGEPITLMDLRRKTKIHEIGEHRIEVRGLTMDNLCGILERFPALASLALGGTASPLDIVHAVPGALAAWVAAACGHPGDSEAEKAVDENLTAEDASGIFEASLPLTFSRGFGPFRDRALAMTAHLIVRGGRGQATTSDTSSSPAADPLTGGSGN